MWYLILFSKKKKKEKKKKNIYTYLIWKKQYLSQINKYFIVNTYIFIANTYFIVNEYISNGNKLAKKYILFLYRKQIFYCE